MSILAFAGHFHLRRWHGLRLLAVDGSTARLPNEHRIAQEFSGPADADRPLARVSQLYDVLNHVIVRADLVPYATGEREIASSYLYDAAAEDLLLYDRGYPAFWLIAQHRDMARHFCMRTSLSASREVIDFVASGQTTARVALHPCPEPVTVRLVRVTLDTGETEVLITSLLDEQAFPSTWFKALYHHRWAVEESYKRAKCRIEIENFSGKSALSVYQDFHAKVLALNLGAMFVWIARTVVERLSARCRYPYRVNFANALTQMKNRIVRWLLGPDPAATAGALVIQIARSAESVRPGRSAPRRRNAQKCRDFHGNYKRTR